MWCVYHIFSIYKKYNLNNNLKRKQIANCQLIIQNIFVLLFYKKKEFIYLFKRKY